MSSNTSATLEPEEPIHLPNLPGLTDFEKCQDPQYPEFHPLDPMAVDVLTSAGDAKVCTFPMRSRKATPKWKDLLDTVFDGHKNSNGTRDGNGVFRGYKRWTSGKPHLEKLKPLVVGIVNHFSKPESQNGSALVLCSNTLKKQLNAAEKKKEDEKNEKKAQRLQNESAEEEVGFRPPGYGVSAPTLERPLAESDTDALKMLAQPTSSVLQSRAVHEAATSSAAFAAAVGNSANDNARKNEVEKTVAALAVGKSVTKKCDDLDTIKNARNLDRVDLEDSLDATLDKAQNNVMNVYSLIAGSPDTKTRKRRMNVQENINLLVTEIKELQSLGAGFEDDIEEAKEQLRLLRAERKKLSGVKKNLENDLIELE